MNLKFSLRAIQPSDGPALTKLITQFEGDLTTRFLVDPYEAIRFGTEYPTEGVVVEHPDVDGFIGMGTVRFGKAQFNGDVFPFAFLDGLKVHKDFRGQGLGYQIASWRIQRARETFGEKCVIGTGMLSDNHASHAVATKWCREFAESAINVIIVPARKRQPKLLPGITVRQIESHEYEAFASKQNAFYKNHNLYPPGDANSIVKALGVSVGGKKPYRYLAAIDKNGNLLAGAQIWVRGLLKSDTLNNPPAPLRMINRVFHLLPSDFVIRDVNVSGLWYEPSQSQVANLLWETIRYECKDQGTTIAAAFDARDPARQVIHLRPWHQPRPQITLAIHGPAPMDREKLLFGIGRV
ncbi:MAG TPA: GNAT family N-acetyltransferase [Anaerolineales bacterium]|nr:GNAT family N-acetyltransferase [Anaerolineales bacterium]